MSKDHIPSYRTKLNSNGKTYAFIALNGKRIGLGADGSEARQKYEAMVAGWLLNGRFLPLDQNKISIQEMCVRFLAPQSVSIVFIAKL